MHRLGRTALNFSGDCSSVFRSQPFDVLRNFGDSLRTGRLMYLCSANLVNLTGCLKDYDDLQETISNCAHESQLEQAQPDEGFSKKHGLDKYVDSKCRLSVSTRQLEPKSQVRMFFRAGRETSRKVYTRECIMHRSW